jgi:hypothetical protein
MYVEERADGKPAKAPKPPKPAKAPKPKPEKAEKAPRVPAPPKDRAPLVSVPEMAAGVGSAIVGLLVGLLACGATWASLQGCEKIRGTSSCGGPGFLVLLAILLVLVVVGALLLRLFRVPQPPSTSFLAVGLLSMLTLLVLANWIFEWWMVLVIPPLAALCYVLAQWVTRHSADD